MQVQKIKTSLSIIKIVSEQLLKAYLFFLNDICVICESNKELLCKSCETKLVKISSLPTCEKCLNIIYDGGLCIQCLKEEPIFEHILSLYVNDKQSAKIIYALKYKGITAIKYKIASLLYKNLYNELMLLAKYDFMIPVPIHRKREIKRGYNQAFLLAKELANYLDIPVKKSLVKRIKNTKPLATNSSYSQRQAQISGAFSCSAELKGKKIVIIDDIYTTGSTTSEVARTLLNCGAEGVSLVTFLRELK